MMHRRYDLPMHLKEVHLHVLKVEDASYKPTYLHKFITTEKKDKRIYANPLKSYHISEEETLSLFSL